VIVLSVLCLSTCPVFDWGPPGLLAAGPLLLGRVGVVFIECRLSLLILFTILKQNSTFKHVKVNFEFRIIHRCVDTAVIMKDSM
jgi:hypothetical protein